MNGYDLYTVITIKERALFIQRHVSYLQYIGN